MPRFWPAMLVIGVLARLLVWWGTVGSNDVPTWASHGQFVGTIGLADTYRSVPIYNHPPLMGWYAMLARELAADDLLVFARWIKLPGLLGEGLALCALWRLGGVRLAGIYALLPAPILVSAYHGNTDTLYAALVLLAALAFDRCRFALAGAALGAALNVKLIPLVLVPVFLIGAPSWPALARLSLGLAAGIVPYLVPLLLQAGPAMYRNMVAYNSSGDEWGFMAFLNEAERVLSLQPLAVPVRDVFLQAGRWLIMGGAALLAVLARRRRLRLSMLEQVALAAALFLFFAPGFGVQYVAFVAPLLLAVSVPAGVFWGVAAGVFIGALYVVYLVPGDRWLSVFRSPFPGWTPDLGVVAWAGLGVWIWRRLTQAGPGAAGARSAPAHGQ